MSRVVLFGIYKNLLSGANEEKPLQVDANGNLITTSGPGGVAGPSAADIGAATDAALRATPLPVSSPTLAKETGGNLAAVATALNTGTTHTDLVAILTKLSNDPATQTTLNAVLTALNTGTTHTDLTAILTQLQIDLAVLKTNTGKISQFTFQLVQDLGVTPPRLIQRKTDAVLGISVLETLGGVLYVPVGTLSIVNAAQSDIELVSETFQANTLNAGNWAINDILTRVLVFSSATGTITNTNWYGASGALLGTAPIVGVDVTDEQIKTQQVLANLLAAINLQAKLTDSQPVNVQVAGTEIAANAGAANAQTIRTISASDDPMVSSFGTPADAAQVNPATPATLFSYIKGGLTNWATFLARIPASLGAKLAAASFSITLASDDAQLGTDVTGIAQSVGGTGGRGWLSEIVRVLRLSDPTDVALPTPAPGQSVAGNNLLLSVAGSDWLDLGANNNYSSLMVSLAASVASGGTGQVVCEGTTDPVLGQAYSLNRAEGTGVSSSQFTLTTNVVRAVEIFVPFRYVKLRLVTPPASGTVTAFQVLGRRKGSIAVTPTQSVGSSLVRVQDSTQSFTLPSADVAARALFARITDGTSQQAVKAASTTPVAADPAAVVSISPNSSVQLAPVSAAIADVTASAIAAVGVTTSAAIVPTWGVSQSFELVITAPSGAPVLDVAVQELIAGAWITVYAFPSVSIATTLSSNLIAQAGRQYRYQYTFSGTGSITRAVNRYQSNTPAPVAGRNIPFTTANTSGTANTSTTAIAANPARKYLFIQNLSASPMFITTGAAAVNNSGIRLAPNGGSQEFSANGLCPTNAIQIICPAAATQPYTVVEA
jgi:hypothetical protein